MTNQAINKRFWTGVPPWIFMGAVAVLFPIFAFMTLQNINRQKKNSMRLLAGKGAALIQSFEAGTRTGMGMNWSGFQLQKLLAETVQQLDILYLLVTDINGIVMVHNNPAHHQSQNQPRRMFLCFASTGASHFPEADKWFNGPGFTP